VAIKQDAAGFGAIIETMIFLHCFNENPDSGGSVCLNSRLAFLKLFSSWLMLPPLSAPGN
jgi:hypothetical protein